MEFEQACSEIDYIFEHMNPRDKEKIPEKVRLFFKNNKSLFYKVNLDVTKKLATQELKEETKAFIQIIRYKYFLEEAEKKEFYEIFKDEMLEKTDEAYEEKALVLYQENKIMVFLKKIFRKLKKVNNDFGDGGKKHS